jgi:hypothetical protein
MSASQLIWVDECDVATDLGLSRLSYYDLSGWGADMVYNRDAASVIGVHRQYAAAESAVEARNFRVICGLDSGSVANRDAQLSKLIDIFAPDVLHEFRFADSPNKILEGVLAGVHSQALSGAKTSMFALPVVEVHFDVTCYDPRKRDRFLQSVGGPGSTTTPTRYSVPTGNLCHGGQIWILGSCTNPVITVRNLDGTVMATMSLTVTLGAGEFLVINLDNQTFRKWNGTVWSDPGLSIWTAGDFFQFNPAWGSLRFAAYPTIELAATTNPGVLTYYYYRNWSN